MEHTPDGKKESEIINIQWQAPEFEKYEKGPLWFIILGAIALIVFTVSLLAKNFIFSFLIVLIVFAVFIYALKEPRIIKFIINGEGLYINEKLIPYQDLDSFWIFYQPPKIKELSIKSKKWSSSLIKIPLAEQDLVAIRRALIKFIPEKKQEESLVDNLTKSLRF